MALIASTLCVSNYWRTYKYYLRVINVSTRLSCVNSKLDSTWLYILVCKNECLYVLWNMLWCAKWMLYVIWNMFWCAKWMFVRTMKYALVYEMYVCMYYELCVGVLSWTQQHNCPGIVTCTNCPNCNWKWAIVLILYNIIAQECNPYIWHLVSCIPRSVRLLLACPQYWPLISRHKGQATMI